MPNETNSPVKMVTAAYLDPSYFSEEPVAPETVKSQNTPQNNGFEKGMRVVSCVIAVILIGAFLWVAPADSMRFGDAKKGRGRGVDWMLWAVGAKKSARQKLFDKIERNRKVSMTPSSRDSAMKGEHTKFDQEKPDQQSPSTLDEDLEKDLEDVEVRDDD